MRNVIKVTTTDEMITHMQEGGWTLYFCSDCNCVLTLGRNKLAVEIEASWELYESAEIREAIRQLKEAQLLTINDRSLCPDCREVNDY